MPGVEKTDTFTITVDDCQTDDFILSGPATTTKGNITYNTVSVTVSLVTPV